MKLNQVQNYDEMSRQAASILISQVRQNPSSTLGLATGGTPLGIYACMVADHRENATSYAQVSTVNLDEYVGLKESDSQSYHFYMQRNLFSHIDIPRDATHIPNGMSPDLLAECRRYDDLLNSLNGVDIQLLGIGANGHIGFNEPGTSFQARTHIVELTETTRAANGRYFPSLQDVPHKAITMGIASIMESRHILLLASGTNKAEAVYALFCDEVSEQNPSSILKKHANVTVIADEAALILAKQKGCVEHPRKTS
ncbi:glucosamine-6-phosphate deaminase [Aneurinibacillus sp. Ricciae_BoGa-3]|uniref:glucosamine-6-phosphate deaminase n=1 Tax=Aneurinibacillus sp. Ricciae_BoGa-3 TaxID=3022697 RepID=UPI00234218D9|nr:glucosamine-6-phosphate deaminase [Aneurinibacillus sp. Ricciae_BoGa-3]WCK53545.1 glucosamine-6-phosphate deaminase [Aneurinibacillus sp. Ricciae_BoGa-3]